MSAPPAPGVDYPLGAATCFGAPLEPTRPLSVAATAAFCLLSVLPFVPQYAKFILRQSAEGVSRLTLAFITFGFWLQLWNLLILHYDQLRLCFANGAAQPSLSAAAWACDHSLTTLAYMVTSLLAAAPLLPVAVYFTPAGPERDNGVQLLGGLGAAMAATGAPAAIGLAVAGACAPLAAYAASLGIACGVLYLVMYIPQVMATVAAHGSASLSYLFLWLHVVLGVAAAFQKADGTHERVLTWAPPLVANAMQLLLIGMQLHYDARRHAELHARGGGDAASAAVEEAGEKAPLAPAGPKAPPGYGAVGDTAAAAAAAGDAPTPDEIRFSKEWWLRFL